MSLGLVFLILALNVFELISKESTSVIINNLEKKLLLVTNNFEFKSKNDIEALTIANDLLHHYRNSDPQKAIKFGENFINQTKNWNDSPAKAITFTKMGNIYHDLGKYHLAIDNYSSALKIFEKIKDSTSICSSYNDIGYIFSKLQMYDMAIKNYFAGTNYVKYNNDKSYINNLAHAYSNISYDFFNLKQVDSAIYYGKKSRELFRSINSRERIAQLNNYLAEYYAYNNDFNTALSINKSNLDILDTFLIEDRRYLGHTYRIMSKLYIKLDNKNQALESIEKAIKILEEIDLFAELNKCLVIKSNILKSQDKIQDAIVVLEEALKISKNRNSFTENLINTEGLANLYNLKGDLKKSIYYYNLNKILYDSLINIYNKEIVNKVNVGDELKNKDLKLELISKKNEINGLWLKVLGFSIILFFIFFLIIYLQFKNKSKINEQLKKVLNEVETTNLKLKNSERNLLEINRTKDRFFGLIAHDLRGPISSFHTATGLLIDEFETLSNSEKLDFLLLIKDNAKRLSNLLNSLLQWAKSQQGQIIPNPSNIDVNSIVEETIHVLKPLANKKHIKLVNQVDKNHCVKVDSGMIGTTLNNIINNSIKFSYPHNEIILRSFEIIENNKNYIALEIEDFGIGIDPERLKTILSIEFNNSTPGTENEEGSGLGLVLAKEFIEKNNGIIKIKSEFEIGTVITICLPKCDKI